MYIGNLPSIKLLPSTTFDRSGMGGIWSDIMTAGVDVYKQKTAASIASSQADQAAALARTAAANAAAISASRPSIFTMPVVLGGVAVVGLVAFLKLRKLKR